MNGMNRRDLLKISGAVSVWTTPIVNSVLLPAHAQTSIMGLVNITSSPPPGLRGCQRSNTATISLSGATVQNVGSSSITITDIDVSVDIGASVWSADTSLPITLSANETLGIRFTPSPIFTCTSSQNPRLTVVYQTNIGAFTFMHFT